MPRKRPQPGKKPREAVRPKRNQATKRAQKQREHASERTTKSRTRPPTTHRASSASDSADAAAKEATDAQAPDTEAPSTEPEIDEAEATQAEPAAITEPEVLPPEPDEEETLPVPVERDLARVDALQRYMAEVARHPLLTREQEHELAVKFRETQDPAIAYRLVTANHRLVVKIAHEYRRAAFNLLDPIQEGTAGLMQAVQTCDPYRGVKLSSYAAWWVRASVF